MTTSLCIKASRLIVFGLLLAFLSACQTQLETPRWQWQRAETGLPRQAIFLTIAADPLDPNRLWAGFYDSGGLAMSTDGGQTWTTEAAGLADNPVFDLLALPSTNSKSGVVLWAATRDGLMQSNDSGASWQLATGNLPPASGFALAADDTGRLYAGFDDNGIYWQTEDGVDWIPLAEGTPLASAAVFSLVVSANGRQIYAGTPGQGVWASSDRGQNWVAAYPGEYAPALALNPSNANLAIASLRERLVRTQDGGQSWHTIPLTPPHDEFVSLLWLADGTLGAGTSQGRLYRSNDNGDTWMQGGNGLPPGGVLSLAVSGGQQLTDNRLFVGAWTGVYASDDGGQTLTYVTPSLGTPRPQTLLATHTSLFLGTGTGLFQWQADSQQWQPITDSLPSGVSSLAADPANEQIMYAGTLSAGPYRSDDAGATWHRASPFLFGVPALAIDPLDSHHLYMLAAWERVYESFDGGNNWIARWDGLGRVLETTSLAVDPVKSMAYAGTETGLYRSEQGGDWRLTARPLAGQSILALLVRPNRNPLRGSVLYIGATQGIYRSLDNGQTIQGSPQWGRGLENVSVTSLLADPHKHEWLVAGTAYAGVFQSLDGGYTWQPIDPNELRDGVVNGLAWGPNGALFVLATNGVWRANQ